ncbi:acyl-CoA thioesterase [Paraburkholderia sp. SIMBA_030]|uniref:acyl-CoA thioesterase n=1 Tax=Paraburkholderia sp. SIMBA_030 TaxID=3085773 RepID=UPI00397D7389
MNSPDENAYCTEISTRWSDNDIYGHVNNVIYYSYFDTVVNEFLIANGDLDIHGGKTIGLVVESMCKYHRPLAFPGMVKARLRVGRIGTSSVRYEISLFGAGDDTPSAEGHFVHVFVDRSTRKSVPLPRAMRKALESLMT